MAGNSKWIKCSLQRHDKKEDPGGFEPRNPVLQASSLTPTPEGLLCSSFKMEIIYGICFMFQVPSC